MKSGHLSVRHSFLSLTVMVALLLVFPGPELYAETCRVSITSIEFPPKVNPNQDLQVEGEIRVSCTRSSIYYSVKEELVEQVTGRVLSKSMFQLGYAPSPAGNWTLGFTNNVSSPSASGIWSLAVKTSVLGANQLIAYAEEQLVIQVGTQRYESTQETSILRNGDFENGLSFWQIIDSGSGASSTSAQIAHSGTSSLVLSLFPISSVASTQIQGILQRTLVRDLRGLGLTAWYLTTPCSLPAGSFGRLRLNIGGLSVNYELSGTCGKWQTITYNVTRDLELAYGLEGLSPFQQIGDVEISLSLELVRSGANAMALAEYVSMNWDDVELIALVPAVSIANATALTTSTTLVTTEAFKSSTTGTTVETLTETWVSRAWTTEQAYGWLTAALAGTFAIVLVLVVKVRTQRRLLHQLPYPRRGRCPECGGPIPDYRDVRYCQECGADLLGV